MTEQLVQEPSGINSPPFTKPWARWKHGSQVTQGLTVQSQDSRPCPKVSKELPRTHGGE